MSTRGDSLNTLKMDLSGQCLDEVAFEVRSPQSHAKPLFEFDLAACADYLRSEQNVDDRLTSGLYRFNHCSAFETAGRRFAVCFRLIAKPESAEVEYQFSVYKVFQSLRPDKWYFNALDTVKQRIAQNAHQVLAFIRECSGPDEADLELAQFLPLLRTLGLITDGQARTDTASRSHPEVYLDDVQNYQFDSIEDLRGDPVSFDEKAREFARKCYLDQRARTSPVFDSVLEAKLFFGWLTSFQFRIGRSQLMFLFFDECLGLLKTVQE